MTISCPKCGQSYEVEVDAIGKECECQCGYKFKLVSLNKTGTIKQSVPTSAALGVAIAFRIIACFILACGFLSVIGGIAYFAHGGKGGLIAITIGFSASVIASLPLFAMSIIIESLAKIASNTSEIVRKMSIDGK
ncbi:MAG: hypothetical protein GX927_13890 [Lentisphaerae bacterium]|jgi:hypothetical protein|nr:hypothetical protein [Lentisphaerota bacterium]